jgi:hypothetical protein
MEPAGVSSAMVGGVMIASAVIIPSISALLALFITRREADAMTKRVEALEALAASERQASNVSRARLYEKVERVERDLSDKIDGVKDALLDRQDRDRSEMQEIIRSLPNEILAGLKNSAQFHEANHGHRG